MGGGWRRAMGCDQRHLKAVATAALGATASTCSSHFTPTCHLPLPPAQLKLNNTAPAPKPKAKAAAPSTAPTPEQEAAERASKVGAWPEWITNACHVVHGRKQMDTCDGNVADGLEWVEPLSARHSVACRLPIASAACQCHAYRRRALSCLCSDPDLPGQPRGSAGGWSRGGSQLPT